MQPLRRLRNLRIPAYRSLLGFGDIKPVFVLPSTFVQRMGSGAFDSLYSGTYQAQGQRIGYIRMPDFLSVSPDDFQTEINYMQNNTDGLILDIMHNPGGDPCLADDLLSRIIPNQFQ